MKSYDVSRLPTMITLGYDGENNWRPNSFDCSALLKNHPDGVLSLWLLPKGESQAFPVALERDGNTVIWTPLSEEMTAATGAFQIVCTDGTDVGKSAVVLFRVDESILPGADHPAAVPSWATQVMEQYQDAVEHYPQIIDSTWHVWDVENETWEDTGVSAQGVNGEDGHSPYIALNGHWMVYSDATGEWIDTGVSAAVDEAVIANAVAAYLDEHPITVTETDPTVPQWAKQPTKPTYTAAEVGALPADTPIPAAVTEQTVAGWGFTKNTGTYSKPSGGIPKTDLASGVRTSLGKADTAYQKPSGGIPASDLASGVIPTVPQMATAADMSDWVSGKTVDAATLKTDFGYAVDLIDNLGINKADRTDIPTAVSELTNDSGFVTAQQAAASAPVQSVNGKTGAVSLGAADVHALPDSTVIPPTVTEQTVAGWGFTKNTGTYSKPSGGIPASDLASDVRTSLGKADTALQSAPVTSVNNKTGAVTLTASDVGALPDDTPIPAAVTEQTVAGWGFTKNTGTYSKPSGGIPASDLAAGVQTSLGKADTALQQHQSLSGYATEQWVQQQGYQTAQQVQSAIASAAELPSGGSAGDFLRKTASGVAWETVPSAESNSFGGGS